MTDKKCLECDDTGFLVRGKHPTLIGEPCYPVCQERALRTLTPGTKAIPTSKERCGIVGCVLDKGHPGSVHNTTAALVEMARACAIDLRRVGRPTAADGVEAIAKEVERLKYELEVQKGVVDFAYIPHRNLVEQRDRADSDFKNFHRLLCARFGYGHDEKDWRRDQLSLIEWIANRPTNETSERQPAVAVLREVLENISTVRPLERFPAVTALAYCREKAIEALNATSAFQEVIVGEYEADGKVNMASSPLPEGTKLYARLPLRHSEKASEGRS